MTESPEKKMFGEQESNGPIKLTREEINAKARATRLRNLRARRASGKKMTQPQKSALRKLERNEGEGR